MPSELVFSTADNIEPTPTTPTNRVKMSAQQTAQIAHHTSSVVQQTPVIASSSSSLTEEESDSEEQPRGSSAETQNGAVATNAATAADPSKTTPYQRQSSQPLNATSGGAEIATTSRRIRASRRRGTAGSRSRASSLSCDDISRHIPCLSEDNIGEPLRRDLRVFFMDPVEKCRVKRQFPWKFALQVLKIVVVTVQIVMFGDMRMSHVEFIDQTVTSLRHFLLKDWEDSRDILAYPPNLPPFAIYDSKSFYEQVDRIVSQYYKLNTSAFGLWMYSFDDNFSSKSIPALKFCTKEFRRIEFNFENNTYSLNTAIDTRCLKIVVDDPTKADNFSISDYLHARNMTIDHKKLIAVNMSFNLKCVHIRHNQATNYIPDCFVMLVDVNFDNAKHSGKMLVELKSVPQPLQCSGNIRFGDITTGFKIGMALIDMTVTLICLLSLLLCMRSLIRAHLLKQRTQYYFLSVHNVKMSRDEELMFLNCWYIFILFNDVCLIVGVMCKFSIEYKILGSAVFNFTGLLLGLGTLFAWIGVLRYLGFFSHYNILILTLKRSFPNVLRFMVCAGLVYMGFLFCGWIILGPYHMKFRDLMTTSECLFALINGDDMFATFTTTSDESAAIMWFARIYLYIFISLFIYIVLSLFISIIMDAYEIVKDKYCLTNEPSFLHDFIAQCDDSTIYQKATISDCLCWSLCTLWKRLRARLSRKSELRREFEYEGLDENDPSANVIRT